MVTVLSSAAALPSSSPLSGPSATSLESPFTVEVMGATVTFVIDARAAWRVRTRTGRVLSSRARQISRTSAVDVEVVDGPADETIEIVVGAASGEGAGVGERRLEAHLPLEGLGHESGPARCYPGGDAPVQEGDDVIGQADGDLGAHVLTISDCIPLRDAVATG